MKQPVILILLIILCSCQKDNEDQLTDIKGESGISYTESASLWLDMKKDNGNSYVYETSFTSWVGFGSTTTLKVVDGEVTERTYTEFTTDEAAELEIQLESYKEVGDEVGDHEKGARPLTIDELYASCASDFLIACPCDNTIYFETETNGLMNLCGFIPKGCTDDCYSGIRISDFEWIQE